MRTGFSTSACAAAAAIGAIRILEGVDSDFQEIRIVLPNCISASFPVSILKETGMGILCGVIKDSGDDPDVTNGLEIQALVKKNEIRENRIFGGMGVGIVTLPGLPVTVGKPAINPGSLKLIHHVLNRFLEQEHIDCRYDITIIVPEGEQIAKKTMNPKLGIKGGISILGTDGIVRPYSIPAFRASIYYEMKLANENGYSTIGLATGKRSASYLKKSLPPGKKVYLIDAGDELGYPLAQFARFHFSGVILAGMIGKLTKVAQGRFQTHVDQGGVDFEFLSELASKKGAPSAICREINQATTAHQVQNWLKPLKIHLEPEIARLAALRTQEKIGSIYSVTVNLYSLEGKLLGMGEILSE